MLEKKFNEEWLYWEEKDAFTLIWNTPDHAKKVTLPHDAMISKAPNPNSPNKVNTAFRDGGIYCYQKYIKLDESEASKRMLIKFEGVYMNTFVYINGELAAKRPYGYSTFYVEMDKYLNYGQDNEIRVYVRNGTMTNSRWYSGGGIYRDVYLMEGDLCHIKEDGLKIHTESLQDNSAVVNVNCAVCNHRQSNMNVVLKTKIFDSNQTLVKENTVPLKLYKGEDRHINARISLENPYLWDSDQPNLYTCVATLLEEDKVLDVSETSFGIRTLVLDAVNGLRVNGKGVKLRGVCLHHDSGVLGAATYDVVQHRQIRKLKEAGVNAIRMAHNPMAQSMLRACDEIGMYVMDESFDMWSRCKSDYDYAMNFDEWWEKDLQAMVEKDYNHPSVIMYSLGNEIPDLGNRYGVQLSHKMSTLVKALDPTRYTLTSINGVFAAGDHVGTIVEDVSAELVEEGVIEGSINNFMALMADHMDRIVSHPAITDMLDYAAPTTDIAGYNYMAARYEVDGEKYPDRIIVGSETYPPAIGKEWQMIEKLPHVIGDFSWTGWDYLGEAGVGIPAYSFGEGGFGAQFPCQLAFCGDFDLIGNRRPASYYREIVYGLRKEPYMVVINPYKDQSKLMKTPWIISDGIPSWTFDIEEGTEVILEVYAPGDEVEIFINEVSVKRVTSGRTVDYKTLVTVPYQKGTLKVLVYENNVIISQSILTTYDDQKLLQVTCDRDEDMIFAEIIIRDGMGNTRLDCDTEINIEVQGPADLLGFGSGDPKASHSYISRISKTYNGSALAILKAHNYLEEIRLTVTSDQYDLTETVLL